MGTFIDALATHPGTGLALATFIFALVFVLRSAVMEAGEHLVIRYWAAKFTAEQLVQHKIAEQVRAGLKTLSDLPTDTTKGTH